MESLHVELQKNIENYLYIHEEEKLFRPTFSNCFQFVE